MTPMSEPSPVLARDHSRKLSTLLGVVGLARPVHVRSVSRVLVIACAVGGCVIPPQLSVEQDAGTNSPPAILAVRADDSELPEPGPVLFDRGATAGTFSVEVIDTDVGDSLFVRAFVDYTIDSPTAPRVFCRAEPEGKAIRTTTCDATALCLPDDVGQTRNLTIVVFDRQPLDAGDPPHRAMPPGGLSTNRFYFLRCQEPPQ